MLILLLCLLFCTISNGEYNVTCGDDGGASFVESEDGVHGRYRLQWCMPLAQALGHSFQWVVSLRYNADQKPDQCSKFSKPKFSGWEMHSRFDEDVTIDLNCTNVCLSTNLDLIFNGTCYEVKTLLRSKSGYTAGKKIRINDYVYYVYNNYTQESFSRSQTVFQIYLSGDHVETQWFLGQVPVTSFTMVLCPAVKPGMIKECVDVSGNCSARADSPTRLRCALWPPAAAAPYSLLLRHAAPWTSGVTLFDNITSVEMPADKSVIVSASAPAAVSAPARTAHWWALGGVLLLALGGGALLLAYRSLLLHKLRERVDRDWRTRRQEDAAAKPEGGGDGPGSVLLLYARDCAPMMQVAAELRALLQCSADHVYDLYSADTVASAARAAGDWLRRLLARPRLRVVLLQSPAAALTLEQPLAGRRAVHRAPHSSDSLLPLALRLLADGAHAAHSYKKFYIATIAGLEAEVVREVTPLRRYSLPAAAPLLLRDLAPGAAAPPALLRRLGDAVAALRAHVAAHPDYLDDELIFFDYD